MERDQALKFMHDLLRLMLQKNGSDLFITTNFPPAIKIDGKIVPQSNQQLTHTHTAELPMPLIKGGLKACILPGQFLPISPVTIWIITAIWPVMPRLKRVYSVG